MLPNCCPFRYILIILMAIMFTGCGGGQKTAGPSAKQLLAKGDFSQAREIAQRHTSSKENLAIIAISYLAEQPDVKSAHKAVEILTRQTGEVNRTVTATQMLSLVETLPPIEQSEFYLLSAEAALGATGFGTLALSRATPVPKSQASQDLAVLTLEILFNWATLLTNEYPANRLLEAWNSCYTLLGGSLGMDEDLQAWKLYLSISGLALIIDKVSSGSDLSKVLFQSTIGTLEQNPSLAIAAKCDLGSPIDKLRHALRNNRKLISRLEQSIAPAGNCTRGTFAPTE